VRRRRISSGSKPGPAIGDAGTHSTGADHADLLDIFVAVSAGLRESSLNSPIEMKSERIVAIVLLKHRILVK